MGKWKGDSNPGGPGGRTRKIPVNKPRGKTSHRSGDGCAVMAIALTGGLLATLTALGWAAVETVKAVL